MSSDYFLKHINPFIIVKEIQFAFSAVGTGSLNII
jgi:hypothetical protein